MRNKQIINNQDYKKGLIQYRNYITTLKKNNFNYNRQKKNQYNQNLSLSMNPQNVFHSYDSITCEENHIIREIENLDKNQMMTFSEEYCIVVLE